MSPINRCFGCQKKISQNDEFEFIFGEIGEEMNIMKLLNECFNLHIEKDDTKFQALCESCLTDLVETFDKLERDKLESKSARKETLEEDDEMKNIDFIIEEICEDDEVADDLLAEFEGENENEEEIVNADSKIDAQSIDEEVRNVEEILLSLEVNCDETDEIKTTNNREEYVEIDYLDDADDLTKLEDYLHKSLCDLKDSALTQIINCRFCNETLDTHGRLLYHCKDKHKAESKFTCIIDENCGNLNSYQDLSKHFLLKHYDLRSMTIYSQCLCCSKRFNNLMMLNKHSCYESKTISRSTTECNLCDKHFRSNKRYRFHIQFHLEKYRPKACLICRKFYEDDDELFEHVMYEREPEGAYICKLCDRNFILLETFENHKNTHHLKRPYACEFCQKTYLSSQQLQDHLNSQHIQKKIYKCHICNKEFFKRYILQKHIQSHREPVDASVFSCNDCGFLGKNRESIKAHIVKDHNNLNSINIIASIQSIGYCCEYCEMSFNSIENLLLHRNEHKDNLFECPLCSTTYDSYKKAKTHRQTHQKYVDIRKMLPISRHYVCDFENCTNNYAQWITLVSHKRNTHLLGKQQPFKCKECNLECATKRHITQHMQEKHGKEPQFPCSFCPKVYSTSMAIAVHVARMHNNNKLSCEHCGILCKNKDALEKHITNTHDKFICDLCNKLLKNMKNLKTHIKMVHKKERRYFCQYCKRGYYNNCDRLTHEQAIHVKNKIFTCDICEYTTPYRESILVHEKNHTNTKPFECFLCNKRFVRRYALTLHQRRHAGGRKFRCPHKGCVNSYPNKSLLNTHIKKKHPHDLGKSKLTEILEEGIPDDYLRDQNEITEDNYVEEINCNSEEIYLIHDNGNADNDNGNDSNKDDNIEYIFTKLNDNDDINEEEDESDEYIDNIEDVEMDDVKTITLDEDDKHNYIIRGSEEIGGYEIVQE